MLSTCVQVGRVVTYEGRGRSAGVPSFVRPSRPPLFLLDGMRNNFVDKCHFVSYIDVIGDIIITFGSGDCAKTRKFS